MHISSTNTLRIPLPCQFEFSHVDVQLGIFISHTTEVDICWLVGDFEPKLGRFIEALSDMLSLFGKLGALELCFEMR